MVKILTILVALLENMNFNEKTIKIGIRVWGLELLKPYPYHHQLFGQNS